MLYSGAMPRPQRAAIRGRTAAAWGVHLFTAAGAVAALLALIAVERRQPETALFWLFVALAIDGVDGTLARAVKVRERIPRIDGEALDLVVDYLTYVLVPVWFILEGGYLPGPLALPLCAAILVSALYIFARRDMKTDDGYFRGFPALWNVVAFYFFVLKPAPPLAAGAAAALVVMTFAPIHTVHPFRVRDYGPVPPSLAILWAATTAGLLSRDLDGWVTPVLATISFGSAALLAGMGLLRTLRGPRSRLG